MGFLGIKDEHDKWQEGHSDILVENNTNTLKKILFQLRKQNKLLEGLKNHLEKEPEQKKGKK